jgi:hypothetical protein
MGTLPQVVHGHLGEEPSAGRESALGHHDWLRFLLAIQGLPSDLEHVVQGCGVLEE